MTEVLSFSFIAFSAVAQTFVWLILRQQEKRIRKLERAFLAHLKAYRDFVDIVGKTSASQQNLNNALYDLTNLHHVALGLNTGVSEEISKFLKDNNG